MGGVLMMSGWRGHIWVLVLSLSAAGALLWIERAIGISWDYHPDAVTYVTLSSKFISEIAEPPLFIFNRIHYALMYGLRESVVAMTALNMLVLAFTNVLIFHALKERIAQQSAWVLVLFLVFLLNPYRLHLATTVLKDTLIIFCLALVLTQRAWWAWAVPLLMWRVAALMYLSTVLPKRWLIAATLAVLALLVVNLPVVLEFAQSANNTNMRFRTYDEMPNFADLGLAGTVLRMLVWPLMSVTGVFVFFSSSWLFMPVALGALVSLALTVVLTQRFSPWPWLAVYTSMAAFAFFASGFTTYIRYVYPLIGLLPLAVGFFDRNTLRQVKT
jgi:hypothetical protein